MSQNSPTKLPKKLLPTMYDLPCEDVGEFSFSDDFYFVQAELLNNTFRPSKYSEEEVFSDTDLKLYYDVENINWHRRRDWFAAVGIDHFHEKKELRSKYRHWKEEVNPFIVVELLSPCAEKDDLAQMLQDLTKPSPKWQVYSQILQIPYYVVFDRYEDKLRIFKLNDGNYQPLELSESRLWLDEIGIGIGVWHGYYKIIDRLWLRWYDSDNNWIPTPEEIADTEKQKTQIEK